MNYTLFEWEKNSEFFSFFIKEPESSIHFLLKQNKNRLLFMFCISLNYSFYAMTEFLIKLIVISVKKKVLQNWNFSVTKKIPLIIVFQDMLHSYFLVFFLLASLYSKKKLKVWNWKSKFKIFFSIQLHQYCIDLNESWNEKNYYEVLYRISIFRAEIQ
jgi:hypothetical protein